MLRVAVIVGDTEKRSRQKSKVVGRQVSTPPLPPPLFFALQVDVIITLECSHSVLVSDVFSFFFSGIF